MTRRLPEQNVLLTIVSLCMIGCVGFSQALSPVSRAPTETKLGPQTVLLGHGQLGLKYFPDGNVSSLRPTPEYACRMVVPVGVRSYLVEGRSFGELIKATKVLGPGKAGQFDNGYAGISSVHYRRDGKLYGFYHAEDQEDMPPIGGGVGVPGFYCSVAMAVSEDEGRSWQKLGQAITSAKSRNWVAFPNQADRGCGEVGVAPRRDGKYLLAYYTEHSRMEGRGVQICMARAAITEDVALLPGAWRKYRLGRFDQPGIGGLDTPVLSVAHMDNADGAGACGVGGGGSALHTGLDRVRVAWQTTSRPPAPLCAMKGRRNEKRSHVSIDGHCSSGALQLLFSTQVCQTAPS